MRFKGTAVAAICCVAWSATAFAEGTTFSTVISSTGALLRGAEAQTSKRNSIGNYQIAFKREIGTCAFVAGVVGAQGGQTSVRQLSAKVVQIFTFSKSGAAADKGFNLLTVCDGGLPPIQGELVINEVLANPFGTGTDAQQEWFELFNPTQKSIALNGLTVATAATSQTITCNGVVAPSGFALFARSADTNGGLPPVDCLFSLTLVNTGGSLTISRGNILVDAVDFTGTSWPDGRALSLDPSAQNPVANDSLANWCNAQNAYSANFGTPKAANPDCSAAGIR